ncbi:MAG: hypothetical protein HKN89_08405, partial [Eudoraea sp.]|nr:hypothetical protein [Eudoraea sp.]
MKGIKNTATFYQRTIPVFLSTLILFWFLPVASQEIRVEPPNWWAGMRDSTLQLMVHSPGIGAYSAHIDSQEIE